MVMKLLLAAALALAAPDRTVVTQTACTSLENKSLEEAKQELLLAARRDAVEKLFGSLVTSLTQVEDLKLQKDKIQAASSGYVLIEGEPELYNGQSPGELCVKIRAYTLEKDRAEIDRALRTLADTLLNKTPPKYVLDADLDLLGLGSRAVMAVVATPLQALEGARCAWTVEPADVLRTPAPDGACRLEVAMPAAPLPDRGSTLPARISVRISRDDEVLDELSVRGAVHNGIPIEPVVSGSSLKPGAAATVRIVPRGRPELPPGFTCSWSLGGAPLAFKATTKDECQGRLELKPEDEWTRVEGMEYSISLMHKAPVSVSVRLLHQGALVNEGTAQVDLTYNDTRDPEELLRNHTQLHPRRGIGGVDDFLTRAGLPTLSSLNEKNLEVRLAFENDQWAFTTYYTGDQPPGLKGPLDKQSGYVRVLYSHDGQEFEPWYAPEPETAQDLASLDHVWVKIQPGLGGEPAGPFRLALDFPTAARVALASAWQAWDKEEKQRFACSGLVAGRGSFYGDSHHPFLAILDEVSVGRGEGALWRTRRYGSRLESLFEKEFERVPPPVGPTDYVARLRFASGEEEVFACPFEGHLPGRKAGLQYYRLKRTAKSASMPEEIEVYLKHQDSMGWTAYFGDGLKPAFVRVSTDGKNFSTVEQDYRNRGSVSFPEPEGGLLVLRFVAAGGEEMEYRGTVDYTANRFATLRDALFSASKLTCASYDPEDGDEDEEEYDEDRRPQGITGQAVVCGFKISGSEYMSVANTLPVLRSVAFGCARDQLRIEDRFEDERALGPQGKWEELTFALPGHCDTVFARFTLADGSQSEILAAPVLSP